MNIAVIRTDYLEFIDVISQFWFEFGDAKIDSVMLQILRSFVTKPYLSTYQVQKDFKEKGKNISDEMVRRKIKKLNSLKLIEDIKREHVHTFTELTHGAVYYRLSTGGIFYLLHQEQYVLPFLRTVSRRNFIRYHGDNIIFTTLLYPYLQKQTFFDIKGPVIAQEIFRYLNRCCDITYKIIESIEKHESMSRLEDPLFFWNCTPGQYDRDIIMALDCLFHLNLGQYARVEKIDEGQTLRILDDKNDTTLIKLDRDREDRAFLICSDKRHYELNVHRYLNSGLAICIHPGIHKQHLLESFAEQIQHNVMSLVVSLVIRLTDLDTIRDIEISDNDWRVLLNDRRFMCLLEKSNRSYQEKIRQIMNMK